MINYKELQEFKIQFTNPLSKSYDWVNTDMTSINVSEERSRELPIIDSLISRTTLMENKRDPLDSKDRISLGGASSLGELQWENEIINDCMEQNGNDLEWDHYDEDTIAIHNETDQLILEIEELTKSSSNQMQK